MKVIFFTTLLAVITYCTAVTIQCYPAAPADANNYYIAFSAQAYKYSLPDLNLLISKSYNQLLCPPGTLSNDTLTFAGDNNNNNSTQVSTVDLSILSSSNTPAPYSTLNTQCLTIDGDQYCVVVQNGSTYVQRSSAGNVQDSIQLPKNDTSVFLFIQDPDISGRLQLAIQTCFYRGCDALNYYGLNMNPLSIVYGPVSLPNTFDSGCPVEPAQCDVSVLLDSTFNIRNDIVSYMWSIADPDHFNVTVVSYDARCNITRSVVLGDSLPAESRCGSSSNSPSSSPSSSNAPTTTTLAPTTTSTTTSTSTTTTTTTTTSAPTHPTYCWTCPAGYVHWWDLGLPQPKDVCACVLGPATTSAPTTTTTTTAAPSGSNMSGNNNAKNSATKVASMLGLGIAALVTFL